MEDIRCIHKGKNKVRYFSKRLVEDDHWRKNTGWERDFTAEQPEQIPVSKPDELHLKQADMANAIIAAANRTVDAIDKTPTAIKKKGGRPRKNQQPA